MSMKKKVVAITMALALVATMLPVGNAWAASKMKLNAKKVTLYVGGTKQLKVKKKPKKKKVVWKSSKKKVAKVSKKGKVTAVGIGKATVTAKVGKKKLKCKITVKGNVVPEPITKKSDTVVVETTASSSPVTDDTTKQDQTVAPGDTSEPASDQVETQVVTQGGATSAGTTTTAQVTTTKKPAPTTTQMVFDVDTSLQKPFGVVLKNPEDGIIQVVWGAGTPNCYNVYVDGTRRKTKVNAAVYNIPVQTEGNHTVEIATVDPKLNKESERYKGVVLVKGTAPEETTAIAYEDMPEIDESIQKKDGKMVLQLNNRTNGKYSDDKIYWIVVGRNPVNHRIAYLDLSGNLIEASEADNDGKIYGRKYAQKIVHTLAERKSVDLPAVESGRLYISYGAPVYITFNGAAGGDVGYAGPDVNNEADANAGTLFEYIEFTTESINGGITFHGNTTRVDFFSFPMVARLTDEYGGYDSCVGDIGTRDEIYQAYRNEVSDKFDTLITNERIMCPAKYTFGEGKIYGNYYDDYINRFWNKYASQDLVIKYDGGSITGRTSGSRLIMRDSKGTYYIDKPSTQDVLEGRGAFNRISSENQGNGEGIRKELAIEAQLCAAFTRGIALSPDIWGKVPQYYTGTDPYNEYAAFFHRHAVGSRAYGFCYDDVYDQSTLVECGNAGRFTVDLKW